MPWVPDSREAGYLGPADTPAPLENDAWVDFLQAVVAGVTGLDPTLVRPRWQPEPPNQPDFAVNWAAVGVTATEADWMPAVIHVDTGNGHDAFQRHERVTLLCTFYGSQCAAYAALLRDGLCIDQNQAALRAAAVGIVEIGDFVRVPELVKLGIYRDRMDVSVILRREVRRNYPIMNLLSATQSIQSS